MLLPPIGTFRSGFRACWTNSGGQVAQRLAREAAGEADARAVDVGAGILEQRERARMLAELDADLLKDGLGVALDDREALLVEDVGERDLADDVGGRDGAALQPRGAAGLAAAAAVAARALGLLARRRGDQRPDPRDDVVDASGGRPWVCASSATRMAARCSGEVPQQPPMMRAPASTARRT